MTSRAPTTLLVAASAVLACGAPSESTESPESSSSSSSGSSGGDDDPWAALLDEEIRPTPSPDQADVVFDPAAIATIRLVMPPEAWTDIRDDPEAANWHEAEFHWNGERVERVGVRAFGNGSLREGKPPLKLSFDRYVDDRRWRGLEALKLDNSAQDPTFLNEYLGTYVMRSLGVPAARTGWTTVEVNGEHAGFFVVLESIDDPFLKRWFGDDDGALYGNANGAFGQGLLPTDSPLTYFDPEDKDTGNGSDLVALAEIVARGGDPELAAALHLPAFFRMSVARSVLGSQDAFSADGKNFYLYSDRGRWRVLPWDFDSDLSRYGVAEALAVDLRAPWTTSRWAYNSVTGAPYHDPLFERVLALGADVEDVVDELLAGPLQWRDIDAKAVAAAALIREAVQADVVLGHGPAFDRHVAELRLFLHARLSQLAGREVAECPAAPPGVLRAADLSPAGPVGWGELSIDGTAAWGPGLIAAGEHHCHGVFAHAPSRVTLRVPAGYGALSGAAGLLDWDAACGGATFAIVQDGAVLWQSAEMTRYEPAAPFGPLAVAPGEVVLITDDLGDKTCDTTAWLDLALAPSG